MVASELEHLETIREVLADTPQARRQRRASTALAKGAIVVGRKE